MDAHKAKIPDIVNNSTLIEVPFFQRAYVWKEDLWERFLDDMAFVVQYNRPHFLGTLILKDASVPQQNTSYATRLALVDGQQRLTTFLIFLKVLCLKMNQPGIFDTNFRLITTRELSLQHGKNDSEAFKCVMDQTNAVPIIDNRSSSPIVQAFNYFASHLRMSTLNDYMTVISNVQFVRIDLGPTDDEQQIFDSLNSLGVRLTTSELLKNYFFSRNNITAYQNIWESVFEANESAKAYWDTEIEAGRVKRPLIDIFFDAYFQQFIQKKKYNISVDDKLIYARTDQLANSYQSFVNTYCGGNKNTILDTLKDYATLFQQTFKSDFCSTTIPSDFGIERLNIVIFGLKTTTLIPYVLYLAKNISNLAILNEMYGILESYVMRRIVTRASTTNYTKLFLSFIANEILTPQDLRDRLQVLGGTNSSIPDDAELRDGFEHSKLMNLYSKGVLYLIESHIRPAQSAVVLHGFNNYSLEHLMPKKWRNNWPACPTPLDAEKRDSILLTLGNLAIIPQSLNASIRDSDWSTKKAGKGQEKPGLTLCASGLSTLQDALTKTDWNEIEIQARALWLYKQAKSLWKL